MKRFVAILAFVIATAGAVFLLSTRPNPLSHADLREYSDYSARTQREVGWAPVQLWWEAPLEVKGVWRARKAARLTLTGGEAFVEGTHLPREKIREFLDARVTKGEIDYVVLFTT